MRIVKYSMMVFPSGGAPLRPLAAVAQLPPLENRVLGDPFKQLRVRTAEKRRGLRFAFEERLHAAEQHSLLKRQLDLVVFEAGFERLDRRVVAARLKADGAPEVSSQTCRFRKHQQKRNSPDIGLAVPPS